MRRTLRVLGRGWWVSVVQQSRWGYFVLMTTAYPVAFASIASLMFRSGDQSRLLVHAAIGAGFVGVWNCTLVGSGQALTLLRQQGMLELLVAAPAPFVQVLMPITVASATVGFYGLVTTLAWGRFLFDVPLHVEHPLLLAVAVPAAALSLGLLGVVMAAVFVLYRHANAITNLLGYPVHLVAGFLVPVSQLPGWVHPMSWALAPTWASQAVRRAVLGGNPLPAIGACLALGLAYLALGSLALGRFERLAREHATLELA